MNILPNEFDKIKYTNEYNKAKYYSPKLSLPNKYKAILQNKGKEYGSITKYFIYLIDQNLNSSEIK